MNNQKIVLVRLHGHSDLFVLPEKLIHPIILISNSGSEGIGTFELELEGIFNVCKTISQLKKWGLPIHTDVLYQFDKSGNLSELVESHKIAPGTFPKLKSWGTCQKIEVIQLSDLKITTNHRSRAAI